VALIPLILKINFQLDWKSGQQCFISRKTLAIYFPQE
jgi:hypothetical protein